MDFFPAFFVSQGAELPLAMFVVFASAKLLAEAAERVGIPSIVGEIVAGILIGPSALNLIHPSELLATLADLGVMFLLFRVGLEVKASDLLRVGSLAAGVATSGVVAPFVLGWGVMRLWGVGQLESIFVGASMVATSVGITAQVLRGQDLLGLRSSRIILAAAVIDDVLGLLVLAAVSSMAKGEFRWLDIGLTAALAVAFVCVVTFWGTRTMHFVLPNLKRKMRLDEAEFYLSAVMLFGLALLSVYAGVAAIVGAFLAGMALGEVVNKRVHELMHGTTELLLPFFLVGIGLGVDISQFKDPAVLAMGAAVLVLAVASKLGACGLAALSLGRAGAYQVGAGMTPRGEIGMVTAQIGMSMGVISQSIFAVVVLMAVATTALAPFLLRHAYAGERRSG